MTEPLIAFRDFTYRYPTVPTPALHHLELTIGTGEFVLLAGASGSGKSTLCRLLNGLIPHLHGGAWQGELQVAGLDPQTVWPHRLSREVGLLLQRPDAQCLATTAARDVAFGPACQGLDRPTIAQRVQEAVERLAIAHLLDRSPHTLSCGEQQRVALAGVLALQPRILVLDEPLAFLDTAGAEQLRERLRHLHEAGITIIVAEHRLSELTDLASRMLVLHRGRLVADGAPDQVFAGGVSDWGLEPPGCALTLPPPVASLSAPVIAWEGIECARAGRVVLRGASLAVAPGQIVALFGANGAGKSTLLRHGNGLLRAQGGTVRVLGQPVRRRPVAEMARDVGLVMQQPTHMLFAPTVRAELAAGPQVLQRYDPDWCAQLSARFGLDHLLDRPPHTLSAGEQRRLAIAAVLASRPQVLLLDEPTAGQDAAARATLRTLLQECAAEGVAIVIATHDPVWARSICQREVVLTGGCVVDVIGCSLTQPPRRSAPPLLEKEEKSPPWQRRGTLKGGGGSTQRIIAPAELSSPPASLVEQEGWGGINERSQSFDPRALLIVYLLGCGLILLATHPVELLPLLAIPLLGITLGRHGDAWWRVVRLLGPTLLLFAVIVGFGSGLEAGIGAVLRLLTLVTASVWFFALTPPEELGEALLASRLSPQAVFLLEGTLRFAPTMATLAREVREAQESRGIRLDGLYLFRNGLALLGPLLTSVMRFADDLAEALEARGFGSPTRTPLQDYRFRVQDWALTLGAVTVAVIVVATLFA
jgi:energy-coupling factor transporter ATP-binding protein EcfA2